MNAKFEIDPALLDDAVEILRDAQSYYASDACALARLGGEAQEPALERLRRAKKAQNLLNFFASL